MSTAAFLRDKRVFITGGSSGIGLALAQQAARAGARVAIVARDRDRLAAAADAIRGGAAPGAIVSTHAADITDAGAAAGAVEAARTALGDLDIVINNAGFAIPGVIDELAADAFTAMLAVNYLGAVHITRAALPGLLERGHGAIVNVASMLGFMGLYGYGAYAASKFALVGFTECLRAEVAPRGVQVSIVYAPTTTTPGLERENAIKPPETWALESGSRQFPPEEVAAAILVGVAQGRYEILVGRDSRLIWRAYRYAPGAVRWWLDRVLRRARGAAPGPSPVMPSRPGG